MNRYELLHGDCLEKLKELPDNSVDAVVCDPPYDLTGGSGSGGFMGKKWDATGIAFHPDVWLECLRVLKPGGHLLAFGGTRTYHRMACAIEDAGFDIRDSIHWVYSVGFPKSHNISKALDKAAGAEREVVGQHPQPAENKAGGASYNMSVKGMPDSVLLTAPATDLARQWDGYGTALKPAHEPIVVARKNLDGTIAANVIKWGVGGINIDATRVGSEVRVNPPAGNKPNRGTTNLLQAALSGKGVSVPSREATGRWPSNLLFSHLPECRQVGQETVEAWECAESCAVAELDRQSGDLHGAGSARFNTRDISGEGKGLFPMHGAGGHRFGDSGGASRFFPVFRYQAKAPPKERKVDGIEARHPTQKPIALMRWLVRLVTPPNGVVLDPFTGSGTTGVACMEEGFRFIGCEREDEYIALARARIEHAANAGKGKQLSLLGDE